MQGMKAVGLASCLAFNKAQGSEPVDGEPLLPGCTTMPFSVYYDASQGVHGGFGTVGVPGLDADMTYLRDDTWHDQRVRVLGKDWNGGEDQVWLSPRLPYPAQIVLHHEWGPDYPGQNFEATFEMDRFVPGDNELPRAAQSDSFAAPSPPFAMAAREPWGLSDVGVAAPFTASQAWNYLQTANPDVKGQPAIMSAFTEQRSTAPNSNVTDRTWQFSLYDGTSLRQAMVRQHQDDSVTTALGLDPTTLPPQVANAVAPLTYTSTVDAASPAPWPIPFVLPAKLPTVASLWNTWQNATGRTDADNWGFSCNMMMSTRDGKTTGESICDWQAGRDMTTDDNGDITHDISLLKYSLNGHVRQDLVYDLIEAPGPQQEGIAYVPGSIAPLGSGIQWLAPTPGVVAGASGIALAAAFVALWIAKGAKGIGGIALFSRFQDPDAVHPKRRALMQVIEATPGAHFTELQRRTGQSASSTQHHLRKLLESGSIREVKANGYACYFAKGGSSQWAGVAPLLRAPGARKLLHTAAEKPGLVQLHLARAAGIQPSTASYHMQKLTEAGLVSRADGTVRLTERGQAALAAGVAA
jgi:hypothetical protein